MPRNPARSEERPGFDRIEEQIGTDGGKGIYQDLIDGTNAGRRNGAFLLLLTAFCNPVPSIPAVSAGVPSPARGSPLLVLPCRRIVLCGSVFPGVPGYESKMRHPEKDRQNRLSPTTYWRQLMLLPFRPLGPGPQPGLGRGMDWSSLLNVQPSRVWSRPDNPSPGPSLCRNTSYLSAIHDCPPSAVRGSRKRCRTRRKYAR